MSDLPNSPRECEIDDVWFRLHVTVYGNQPSRLRMYRDGKWRTVWANYYASLPVGRRLRAIEAMGFQLNSGKWESTR